MTVEDSVYGYLPEERPEAGRLILYAIQQVIVMFPATITVALITGFQVSTTIFASGLATLCFILITGKKIPLYYGLSFAYLSAVASMAVAEGTPEQLALWESTGILPTALISKAQFGIIMSGFVSIAAGLLVRKFGKETVEKILPPSITGPISMIIGLTLAGNALGDAIGTGDGSPLSNAWLVVSMVTLLSTIFYSKYLKGFLGRSRCSSAQPPAASRQPSSTSSAVRTSTSSVPSPTSRWVRWPLSAPLPFRRSACPRSR